MNYQLADFKMEGSGAEYWCWAAVAVSIGNFYGTGSWNQCDVANNVLGHQQGGTPDCCDPTDKVGASCNMPWDLDVALHYTRSRGAMIQEAVKFEEVRDEMKEKRPVGMLIEFGVPAAFRVKQQAGAEFASNVNGGHYVVICGCDDNPALPEGPDVRIEDPMRGPYSGPLTMFMHYIGGHDPRWARTYKTQKGGT
jgi:hypothetical protein